MARLSKKDRDDRHTYCKIRDSIGEHARIPGFSPTDSRSDEWKKFVDCLANGSLNGDFGFGARMWFIQGDMDECNDCFDTACRNIGRLLKASEFYVGHCKGTWPVCFRLRSISKAMLYIDSLFRNPPIVRCAIHESTNPHFVPKDTRVGDLCFEFKDVDFCVRFYQD